EETIALIPTLEVDPAPSKEQIDKARAGDTSLMVDVSQRPHGLKFIFKRADGSVPPVLAARSTVPRLLGSLGSRDDFASPGEFDLIVVLGIDGEVLTQDEPNPGDGPGNLVLTQLRTVKDWTGKDVEVATHGTSKRLEIEIAGSKYLAFLQPVHVELTMFPEAGGGAEWAIAGLVASSRYDRESMALP